VFFLDKISLFNLKGMMVSWTGVALSRERLQTSRFAFSGSEASALETYSIFVKKISKAQESISLARSLSCVLNIIALIFVTVFLVHPE
jgi:hypothetical protein